MEEEKKETLQWISETLENLKADNREKMCFVYARKEFFIKISHQNDGSYIVHIMITPFDAGGQIDKKENVQESELVTCIEKYL